MLTQTQIDEAWDAVEGRRGKKLYPYQAAAELGISEAELLSTRIGDGVTRLNPDVATLLGEFQKLGKIKVITRNAHAVHEKIGILSNIQVDGMHAMVLGREIDLRISPKHWVHAFSHITQRDDVDQISFQIFDAAGNGVFKVFVNEDIESAKLAIDFLSTDDQSGAIEIHALTEKNSVGAVAIDKEQLELDWKSITDPHQFFGVLRKHNIEKSYAYRVSADDLARPVEGNSLRCILESAASANVPIMVFVGNHGCTQIHTGVVKKIVEHGPWINVLDETFHLHVKEGQIAESYVVMKPAEEGRTVYSLECFDQNGQNIISIYGEREPGVDELNEWRSLLTALEGKK